MHYLKKIGTLATLLAATMTFGTQTALAKTVKITMHAMETTVKIDNKGTEYPA